MSRLESVPANGRSLHQPGRRLHVRTGANKTTNDYNDNNDNYYNYNTTPDDHHNFSHDSAVNDNDNQKNSVYSANVSYSTC